MRYLILLLLMPLAIEARTLLDEKFNFPALRKRIESMQIIPGLTFPPQCWPGMEGKITEAVHDEPVTLECKPKDDKDPLRNVKVTKKGAFIKSVLITLNAPKACTEKFLLDFLKLPATKIRFEKPFPPPEANQTHVLGTIDFTPKVEAVFSCGTTESADPDALNFLAFILSPKRS